MIESDDVVALLFRTLKNIEADRSALTAAGSTAEEMAETDALGRDVEESLNLFLSRTTQRREKKQRREEHATLVPRCTAAKERFEAAVQAVHLHNAAVYEAEDALARVMWRREEHQATKPKPDTYPSAKKLEAWRVVDQRIERETATARAVVVKLRQEKEREVAREYQASKAEFDRLSFRERELRPPDPPRIVPLTERAIIAPELNRVPVQPGLSTVR